MIDRRNDEWMKEFDRIFGGNEMTADLEAMRRYMEKMMHEVMRDPHNGRMDPYVYGFTLRIGQDGLPHIRRFGNVGEGEMGMGHATLANENMEMMPGRREPLTDIIEADEKVHVTIEIPGVEKKDIDLKVRGGQLVISVDTESHRYYKEVELPCMVNISTTKATYNNGVLDVTLDKAGGHDASTNIQIE